MAQPSNKLEEDNVQAEDDTRGLWDAVRQGQVEKLRLLLAGGVTVDARDPDGKRALHVAADKGDTCCVQALIESGASVNLGDVDQCTPLLLAARRGHCECMRILLQSEASINAPDSRGVTPLLEASTSGNRKCIFLLLEAGANMIDRDQLLPLHFADKVLPKTRSSLCPSDVAKVSALYKSVLCDQVESVQAEMELLLDGMETYSLNEFKLLPLHVAVKSGDSSSVELLIRSQVDVNSRDSNRETALNEAVKKGDAKCISLLLNAGAEVNSTGRFRSSALHLAARSNAENIQILLQAGANVNARDSWMATPLFTAAEQGQVGCVKALLKAGARVNLANESHLTPLHVAAYACHVECVTCLLDAGACVDAKNRVGATPLSFAAIATESAPGKVECARLLLERGAKIDVVDKVDNSPLQLAICGNEWQLFKLFISWNCDLDVNGVAVENRPLYAALYYDRLYMADLLLEGGARLDFLDVFVSQPRKARWPGREPAHHERVTQWILCHRYAIPSLFNMSRTVARKVLKNCPLPLKTSVTHLPLPGVLQKAVVHLLPLGSSPICQQFAQKAQDIH